MRTHKPQATGLAPLAFTLVELLVVISIIVILLALLVGGLERALKAAERSKCASNQRAIATSAAAYALEYERTFPSFLAFGPPPATGSNIPHTALVIRGQPNPNNANQPEDVQKLAVTGIGHLIAQGRVGGMSKGGEAVHCPSLDTTSGAPVKTGMDEDASSDGDRAPANTLSGASYFNKANWIVSGYLYRGKSYSWSKAQDAAMITTRIAKATFGITSDLVTYIGPAANRSGRPFHHITGWVVSFGDGHAEFITDPEGPLRAPNAWAAGHAAPADTAWDGWVERGIAKGQNIHGGAGTDKAAGKAAADATEAVFNYFGAPGASGRGAGS